MEDNYYQKEYRHGDDLLRLEFLENFLDPKLFRNEEQILNNVPSAFFLGDASQEA